MARPQTSGTLLSRECLISHFILNKGEDSFKGGLQAHLFIDYQFYDPSFIIIWGKTRFWLAVLVSDTVNVDLTRPHTLQRLQQNKQ